MKKIYLMLTLWCYSLCVLAEEVKGTGIDSIDKNVTIGQNMLTLAAKWGGVGLLVGAGVMLGMGKLKGEALGFLFYLLLGLGIICAGFSWWFSAFKGTGFAL